MAQEKRSLSKEQIQVAVMIALFGGLIGFVYYKYLWKPYSDKISVASARIEEINSDMARARGTAKNMDKLRADISRLQHLQAAASERLPKDARLPDLLNTLWDTARQYKVTLTMVNPQGTGETEYYSMSYYQITARGTYHSLARMIAALGSGKRIFSFKDLSISAVSGDSDNTVQAIFILVVYRYKG